LSLNMKIITCVLTGAAVLLLGIAGCTKELKKGENKIKIRWVTDASPIRKKQIAIAEEQNPDIKIELDWGSVGLQKVLTQIAGGTPPDIFMVYQWPNFVMLVEKGVLEDLTPYCKKYDINLDDFWPSLKPFIYHKGKVYGLPEMCSVPVVFYNRKLFREAGIPYPTDKWKWEDLLDAAKRLTKTDSSGKIIRYGFFSYSFTAVSRLIALQKGGRLFTDQGKKCIIDSPAYKEALKFLYDLAFKYKVMPTVTQARNMASTGLNLEGSLFGMEKVAMIISQRPCTIFIRNYKSLDWDIAPVPQLGEKKVVCVGTHACVIPKGAKNKDSAFRFLKSLVSDEAELLVANYGEGIPSRESVARKKEFLFNPEYPNEISNQVYLTQMEYAVWPEEISPYISPLQVNRIINEEYDYLWVQKQTVEETLYNIADRINRLIEANLRENSVPFSK